MSNILTIVLRLVPKWVLLPTKQTRGPLRFIQGGIIMKTTNVLRLAISLSFLALFASCAPTSNKASESYQNSHSSESNIIGGDVADQTFAQENGIVGVFDANRGALCTGSLIARNLVLTAAHCINTFDSKAMLVFFSTDLEKAIGMTSAGRMGYNPKLVIQASKALRNEKYNSKSESMTTSTNDIALILLSKDAPASYKTVNLAPADLAKTIRIGDKVSLAGYGVSAYKADPTTHKALMEKGSGILRKIDNINFLSILPSGEEVTFDQTQGRGACHGDSGGPAYYTDSVTKTKYMIGVTSRGEGDCNMTAVYSAVMGQAKWIADSSKKILQ